MNFRLIKKTDLRKFRFSLNWFLSEPLNCNEGLIVFFKLSNQDFIRDLALLRFVFLRIKRLKYRDRVFM